MPGGRLLDRPLAAFALAAVLLVVAGALGASGDEPAQTPIDTALAGECAEKVPHPPIVVEGDEGLLGWTVTDQETDPPLYRPGTGVLAGSGTPEDPYVISGWCITSTATHIEFPAHITLLGTEAHVVVEDNVLIGGPGWDNAITLFLSSNVTVQNNKIANVGTGINVGFGYEPTPNNTVRGNRIEAQVNGVGLADGPDTRVEGNEIRLTGGTGSIPWDESIRSRYGIFVSTSSAGSHVANNTVVNDPLEEPDPRRWDTTSAVGIRMGANETVRDNVIEGHERGLLTGGDRAVNNTLRDNEKGLVVWDGVIAEANEISGHGDAAVEAWASGPPALLVGNDIEHGEPGLRVLQDGRFDARHNWWGDPSGPGGGIEDACTNETATGAGEEIALADEGEACFDPWLEAPASEAGYPDPDQREPIHYPRLEEGEEGHEPIVNEEVDGDAWVTANVSVPAGESVKFWIHRGDCPERTKSGTRVTGYLLYDKASEDAELLAGGILSTTGGQPSDHTVGVHSEKLDVDVHQEFGEESSICFSHSITVHGEITMRAIVWAAADREASRVRVDGDENVTASDVRTGSSAYLFKPEDFDGTLRAHAQGAFPGTWVAANTSLPLQTEHTFLGAYFSVDGPRSVQTSLMPSTKTMHAQTPTDYRECNCWFLDLYRSGEYEFELTGFSSTVSHDLWVTGADVPLPR